VGYDADKDGLGDLPYVSKSLFENMMDKNPYLRLFQLSPAQQAVDMAARAFPIFQPKPKFADDAPLLTPIVPAVTLPTSGPVWPMWVASLLLLLVAVGIVVVGLSGLSGLSVKRKSTWRYAPRLTHHDRNSLTSPLVKYREYFHDKS